MIVTWIGKGPQMWQTGKDWRGTLVGDAAGLGDGLQPGCREWGERREEGPGWCPGHFPPSFPAPYPFPSMIISGKMRMRLWDHCFTQSVPDQQLVILCRASWSLWGLILSVDPPGIPSTPQAALGRKLQAFTLWGSLHYSFSALSMISTSFTLKTAVPTPHWKHLH